MNIANPADLGAESFDRFTNTAEADSVFELSSADYSAVIPCDSIFPQPLFLRMVSLERKRAERSGRRLVLMLLRSGSLLRSGRHSAIEKVLTSLSHSKRDTDITGWYQKDSIIGVLFTEIAGTETSIVDILSRKVWLALRDHLTPQQLRDITVSFHVYPDDCDGQGPGRVAFSVLHPDLLSNSDSKHIALIVKRCIDVTGSVALILVLLPLLLLIACAIKLTSRGPVVFRQKRIGQFGQGFTFLKFRSMYTDTDHSIHQEYMKQFIGNQSGSEEQGTGSQVYKIKKDPRVTKIGAFLRRTSLDELPQLFNVLAGQMSLVGPRPALPYEVESYAIWHKCRLLGVKPGITGFWQVHGRSRVKFDDMVRMDLHYAKIWSLWLDIKILLQTPLAVFTGNGAY